MKCWYMHHGHSFLLKASWLRTVFFADQLEAMNDLRLELLAVLEGWLRREPRGAKRSLLADDAVVFPTAFDDHGSSRDPELDVTVFQKGNVTWGRTRSFTGAVIAKRPPCLCQRQVPDFINRCWRIIGIV